MARVQVGPATCTEHGNGAISQRNSSLPEEGYQPGESSSQPLWMVRATALSEGWALAQLRPLRPKHVIEGLYSRGRLHGDYGPGRGPEQWVGPG